MHLAVHEDRIEITHGTVDIILQSYPWFGPLLPNLRSISLSDYHSYLHLLLSPSVKALDVSRSHVSEIDVPKSIQTALVPLSLDPAQFEEIGIHAENMRWTPATTGEVEGQASLISCCTALRRLSTDIPLTLSAFAALASLTALRKLTLSSVVLDPSITTTPPRSLPFSALRELKLEGPMEDIPPLLARCHLPRLVWLDLTLCLNEGQLTAPLDTTPSPSAYCMDRIAEAICTFAALEALSIRYSGCTGPRRPVVHAAALLPLAALRRLRLVSVDDVYLTPGAVAALARAWPRLERVHMLCRWPWAEGVDMPLPDGKFPAGVVLTDLDPFVLHCPALQPQGVQVHVARNPPRELVRADVGMAVSWEQRKHHFDLKFSAYAADRWGGA
ncbi:hypothetical protein PsYK624_112140 [Phanerochaete sordida]|uniref:F-box domain-containing protein n=1 Tax=Phanerochaete sordida TaxID=48140 RepID=A0A9P3LH71_9APHY|nr:hypothetical protein PsYK624_112140 [Phanerochaete sordida]